MTSVEIRRILELLGTVEWSRISVGRHPIDGMYQPPMVVWRFAEPDERIRGILHEVVAAEEGAIRWVGDYRPKNWCLMPERLSTAFYENRTRETPAANILSTLKASDPKFCEAANVDLERLMRALERTHQGPSLT